MKPLTWCFTIACLALPLTANARDVVSLPVTGCWVASDYDVSSTGPNNPAGVPEEDDDLVFGLAPSAGSTTFTLLVGTHTFGSASWMTSDILTGLIGPGGATAALWTNTDISASPPTRMSFRMFGSWEGLIADMFIGSRTTTTIGTGFLFWEYYRGEEIRSSCCTTVSPAAVEGSTWGKIKSLYK